MCGVRARAAFLAFSCAPARLCTAAAPLVWASYSKECGHSKIELILIDKSAERTDRRLNSGVAPSGLGQEHCGRCVKGAYVWSPILAWPRTYSRPRSLAWPPWCVGWITGNGRVAIIMRRESSDRRPSRCQPSTASANVVAVTMKPPRLSSPTRSQKKVIALALMAHEAPTSPHVRVAPRDLMVRPVRARAAVPCAALPRCLV